MGTSKNVQTIWMELPDPVFPFAKVLVAAGLVSSNSEGFRMINNGSVMVDGEVLRSIPAQIRRGREHDVRIGKRRQATILINGIG